MAPNSVHVPLSRSRNEFRLIELQPAWDPQTPIECRLLHVSMTDDTTYEALSYTWGDDANPKTILLDGTPFLVTRNLDAALRALRRATEERRLWVDALCINQSDVAERNHEVLRMRDIYERAERVIIWLGEAGPDSELAVSHLALLNERFEYLVSKHLLWRSLRILTSLAGFYVNFVKFLFLILVRKRIVFTFLADLFLESMKEPKWRLGTPFWVLAKSLARSAYTCLCVWTDIRRENDKKREPDVQTVEALKDIFSRSWFGRVWVVQEIAMSREAVLVLGHHTIPWKQFSNAYHWLHFTVAVSACGTIYVDARFQRLNDLMWTLSMRRKRRSTFESDVSLLELLCRMSYLQTSDDHDRVYGLFGLCDDIRHPRTHGEPFIPNYDESVEDTYTRLARSIILATGRLDILHCCSNVHPDTALPSWVPDWRDSTTRYGPRLRDESFYLQADPPIPVADFDDGEETIRVRGFVVGQLTDTSLPSYRSHHRPSEGPLKPMYLWALYTFVVPVVTPLFYYGLALWTVRLTRRCAWGRVAAVLEAVEIELSRMPEADVDEEHVGLPDNPVNLTEVANAYDRDEMTVTVFGCIFEPWLVSRCEAGDDVFLSAWCDAYTAAARPGDLICMLHGNPLPTLLRRENGNVFTVVGVASIGHVNFMLLRWCQREYSEGKLPLLEFTLR